ncbi:MAG: fibronectin type III domain-containing protein, partial [Sediminibacterium sp.]|nr:fibronectin type III domain-containing protein [Sediminibacterium sp.]
MCFIFLCSITKSFSQFTDSILSFRNAFFQSTTTSSGGSGDYIQLPSLDMSGHFTIETWYKNTGTLGSNNRVFDFGSGPDNGLVLVGFASPTQIYFNVNGSGNVYSDLPANFRTNDWNHIALTQDIFIGPSNTYLYVNGQLIGQTGAFGLAANSCTSNFIGRSNWSTDAATRAQYHDFRIWKRARSAAEIQETFLTNIVSNTNNLYYYLPLTNRNTANPVQTINIPNNTVLNNVSTSAGFVNASATIISQNGTGAKYYFDSSLQMIYGTYSGTLQTNEIFQLSIDTGKTWIKIDTAFNNHFQDTIPVNFRYGIIQVRSVINGVATSRVVLKDTLTIAPIITYQFNRINTIQGTKGTLDSIIRIDSGGSNRVIKFSITSGKVSGINIDSLNGNISLDSSVAVGLFNITVTATNESGSSNTNIVIIIKAMINNSIRGFYNNAFQTTTVATGGSGDYIRLPTLDMSGNYTIMTWFKNTGTLGSWNRLFEFGSGGVNNGVLIGFPSATQIAYLSNGSPRTINLPNYFNINGWNHIALTYDGSNLRLFINGNYASDLQSPGANYIAANSCTVNYIGRSTYNNDVTTSGEFQEFRIYKSWKSTSDIQKSYRTIDLLNTDDLYYYLPLVRPNIGYNRFINNATSLNNDIISFNQLNQPSTITSQGNTGARYFYDSNRQVLFGTIATPLQQNEQIQYSINSGVTWTKVDTVIDFNWIATFPPSFKWGVIQVRSNIDQNRIFKNDTFYFPPANFSYSANITFDTFGTRGHSVLPTIATSGNTKFRIKTGMVSGISIDSNSGQINWTDSVKIGSYNLTITATNELGFDTINYTLNVVNLLSNFVYSLDSVSVSYGSSGSSVTPTISGLPAPSYRFSSITPAVNGVSINTSTGIISWSNTVPVGTYIFKVIAANSISADSNTYFKLTVRSLKPIISYSINQVTEEQNTADNSVTPTINATGLPITYSIDSFPSNAISINSLTGVISWTKYIPVGTYNLIVKAKHSADSGLTNFTLVISPIADAVLYFSNSAFQTSTGGTGGAGDYVRLPTLDMSGSYTIETWFKNTGELGSWRRVFDFGSGPNSSGILLGFPSPTQIGFHSNGGDIMINIPANFSTIGWNHFALSFDGTNLRLFINGFLVNTNATQPVAAATCTSNFIARSNYNDPTTQGEFQEFRIWKKARTSQEIQASYRSSVQRNSQALYYYLPLDEKLFNTGNIANNTTLANYATASGALNGLSTITSQNNGTGAKYDVDLNRQRLNGRYKDTLLAGETIQVSYDTGLTWRNVRYAANNYWYDSLTTPFNGGLIKLRSILNNIVTSRIFADFIQYLKPTEPIMNYALSNASNSALVSFEPSLRSGGSTLNYNIVSQPGNIMANTTSSPAIITGLTNNTNYTFTVRAVNAAYASEPSLPSNIVTPYDSLIINTSVKNGNINVGPIKTPLGSFYRVTFSPTNSNYLLDSVIINNTLFTDSPFGYTFNNIVTNNTIRVIYKPIYFSVQINEGLNGLNATRKINQIAYGDSLPIKYVAQNGFVVDSIFVNARYVGGGADSGIYIFRNITGDSLIKITYKPKTLLISTTTNNVLGGTINSSNTVVTYGGSVNLNYAPNSGFYVDSVYINRVYNRDTSSNFTINNITSNLEIRVIFTSYETPQPVNNVVALAGYQKAIISFSLPNNYKNTGVVKYYVTSTPGNFTDSGYASPIIISGLTNNTSYTFTVKDSNVNGSSSATSNAVTPTDTTVNIITRVSEGGVIQNSFIIDTNITKTSRVTYTNQTGYVLDSIIINGIFSGRDSLQGYTFRNINGDSTIRLVYKLQTFSITASVNNLQGGTITPFGTNTVLYGSTPVYSLVPNLGYKIDSIKINNINVPLTNNYQFASISSSNTIQAFFGKIKYNIVRTVINGSMYSNTSNAVDYDSTLRVTFNGNAGYILDSVLANGTRVDSVNGYTFVNIRSNQQIQIYYSLPIYGVFSSAIGPASITPLGLSQVNNGDSIRFNLSYLNNIIIDSILVSSIKVTYNNPTTYTIKNITSNQSIVVYSSSLPLPNKPENVITQPLNSNQILLSWLVPTQIVGSEINGYEVTSIRNDGILKIQTSASNRILVNVDSFYTYKFVVKSRNAVGFSAGDTTETFSTIKFVSIIPKLVDDNGLSATDRISTDVRTKLTSADSLAIPIGNQILYSYDSGKTFVVQTYNGGNFIIPQQNSILGNKNILVRVYNGFDTTALNQGLNVILASYPPKITIAGVSKINNQIQIRWDSPILLNQVIPITSYEIQSLPIAGGTPITSMVLFNNDTSFLITGLSSFQGYRTTVKLINAIGKSLTTDTGRIVYNMPQLTPKLYIDNGISSTDNISTDGRSYLLPTGVYENFSDADNVTNSIGPFHPANFPYIKTTASYLATDGTIQRICKLWYQLQSGTTLINTLCVDPVFDPIPQLRRIDYVNSNISPNILIASGFTYKYSFDSGRTYITPNNNTYIIPAPPKNGLNSVQVKLFAPGNVDSNDAGNGLNFTLVSKPSKPYNIVALPGYDTLTIRFNSPIDNGGLPINKVILQQIVGGTLKDSINNSSIANIDSFIIRGLSRGVPYRFSITAVNSFGLVSDTALSSIIVLDTNLRKISTNSVNGTITNDTIVYYRNNARITYKPNIGYILDSIYINNNYVSQISADSINNYTFLNVLGDSSIKVVNKIQTFIVTSSSGNYGSISFAGIDTVNYGDTPTYVFVANTGYVIDSLIINDSLYYNGLNLKRIDSFKFDSIKSNQRIRVTFKVQTFTVTSSAGNYGSISFAGI